MLREVIQIRICRVVNYILRKGIENEICKSGFYGY